MTIEDRMAELRTTAPKALHDNPTKTPLDRQGLSRNKRRSGEARMKRRIEVSPGAQPYLDTLRRIPDDIVLAVAGREINPHDAETCICGWAVREYVSEMANVDARSVDNCNCDRNVRAVYRNMDSFDTPSRCHTAFGGSYERWADVFTNIVAPSESRAIEEAFLWRVMEAAS